jgi:hypothetical protein
MLNIKEFHGRIIDLDTHIQPSPGNYELAGGEVGRNFAQRFNEVIKTLPEDEAEKIIARSGKEFSELTDETVWRTKGSAAPGAFNADNRIKTLGSDILGRAQVSGPQAVAHRPERRQRARAKRGSARYFASYSRVQAKPQLLPLDARNW